MALESGVRKPDKPIVCYVTDRHSLTVPANADPIDALLQKIQTAIDGGVDWIQIREKDVTSGRLLKLARQAVTAADESSKTSPGRRTRIYVNDRLDVALAAGGDGLPAAAGVHLGGESLPVEQVVRWCRAGNAPPEFQIGVSCHSIDQTRAAAQNGADYIFFGPVFNTPSKRSFGPPQDLDRLGEICRAIQIPVIAIGGIDESNAQDCIRRGASGVAAIRLFQSAPKDGELEGFISTLHSRGPST
ncbi:MAG: thiamine phosphate synthase [Candidatus Acidiferrales bacterium]